MENFKRVEVIRSEKWQCCLQCTNHSAIGVGDGRQRGTCPPKIREKYFSGNYYVKFGHFSGKNHVKFGNFVNFSGKYHKNSGILIFFFGQISLKNKIL